MNRFQKLSEMTMNLTGKLDVAAVQPYHFSRR